MKTSNAILEAELSDDAIQQIEALFQTAADLPAAERAAFLDRECGSNMDLLEHVRRLLDNLDRDASLVSPVANTDRHADTFPTAAVTEEPGAVIGRYKLLQIIGEGGFGVVYMAEQQTPVVRKVALKIIKLGMDTLEVVARFEAERQALAMMDHPHIAKVLDGGATDSGRPYFVMELVRGVSITEYCDKNNLDTRQRLELFLQVCHAVQHAHQKGIIHRDLKPSNVMVTLHDGAAMPKVIDFGVAKATHTRLTEKTLFTQYGQFVGTPAYMSPEQAEMSAPDVDTRTDIYSLGVLLYEVLTGTTPFDPTTLRAAGLAEIQRIIREEHPPRPSMRILTTADGTAAGHRGLDVAGLGRVLRGDLDWIVMKALEKVRSRRYATANELADDIRRHLTDQPVIAGPPGAGYRLRKFFARNRAATMSVAIVAFALVAGIIGTTTGMLQAKRNADVANQQTDRAMVAVDFLLSTLSLANPEVALSPDVSVLTLLADTSARVAESFEDYPGAEVRIRATIGRAYARLGHFELAEPQLRRVVEIIDELTASGEDSIHQLRAAGFDDLERYAALWALTNVCFNLDRGDSFTVANRARNVGLAYLGQSHPALAGSLHEFTDAIHAGAWSHAPDAMKQVPDLFERAAFEADASLPSGDPRWPIVADTFLVGGYEVWYTPHEPLGEIFWRKALELQRRELQPTHPDIATTVNLLAGLLNSAGKLAESESLIRESLDALRLVHRDGSIAVAVAEGMLGQTLTLRKRFDEAEPILLKSHENIVAGIKEASSFITLESFTRVVALYDTWRKPDRAKPYRDALAVILGRSPYASQWVVLRHAFGPEHAELIELGTRVQKMCGNISYLAAPGVGRAPELMTVLPDLVLRVVELGDDPHLRSLAIARLMLGWANSLEPDGNVAARRLMARTAMDAMSSRREQFPLGYAEAAALLAACAHAEGRRDEAKRHAQDAWNAIAGERPRGAWFIASADVRIARSLMSVRMYEQAEELLTSAYQTLRAQFGEKHTDAGVARDLLRRLHRETQRRSP